MAGYQVVLKKLETYYQTHLTSLKEDMESQRHRWIVENDNAKTDLKKIQASLNHVQVELREQKKARGYLRFINR